jgi:hypothetical protein
MTGRYEPPTGHDDETGVTSHGQAGGPPGIRIFRAALVLALMIVVGVVLLPSATRGPRLPASSHAAAHHSVAVPTTSTTRPPTTTTTLPAVAYSSIKVLVANGTTTAHGASEVRTWLKDHGFDTAAFPAYDTTLPQSDDSIFIVGSGTSAMALEVAKALTLGPSVIAAGGATPPVSTSAGADVVVVLGNDLASRADAGTLGQPPTPSSNATP